MRIAEQYNKQIDELCNRAKFPDAAMIFELAKERGEETKPEKIEPLEKKVKRFGWMQYASVAAAFVVLFLTAGVGAGAAGYGPFASFFEHQVSNPVTKKLIESGYYMKVDEYLESDGFTVNFVGISGDKYNPQIVLTLRTEDEEFVKNNDTFTVSMYNGLGVEEYETAREDLFPNGENHPIPWYGTNEATAVRSEDDPNTYIVEMWGQSGWIREGADFVVGISKITAKDGEGNVVEKQLGIAFYSSLPSLEGGEETVGTLFHNVVIRFGDFGIADSDYQPADDYKVNADGIQGMIFVNSNENASINSRMHDAEGNPYYVDYVIFDLYETQVHVACTAAEEGNPLCGQGSPEEIEEKLHTAWIKTLQNTVIVADGEEFRPNADTYDKIWYDEEGTGGTIGRCYTQFYLPAIDYNAYERIVLKCGDGEIILKSREMLDTVEAQMN